MGIQFSDWLKNMVGKEGIARYEQFLLFPQCFQKLSVVNAFENVYIWSEGLRYLSKTRHASLSYLSCKT